MLKEHMTSCEFIITSDFKTRKHYIAQFIKNLQLSPLMSLGTRPCVIFFAWCTLLFLVDVEWPPFRSKMGVTYTGWQRVYLSMPFTTDNCFALKSIKLLKRVIGQKDQIIGTVLALFLQGSSSWLTDVLLFSEMDCIVLFTQQAFY